MRHDPRARRARARGHAWPEFPVNEGALCRKGWTATGLRGHRSGSPPRWCATARPVSCARWDEALDLVADRLRALRAEHGADSVAVFGGGGLTNEKAYQLGKLARVALGTSQIDYNGRWCMSSAASAGNRAFGIDRGLPFPLADVEQTDVLVLVGSNLAETMPPAARHLDRLRERGGRVVVIDPRRHPTAERADLFLQPVPGTDLRWRWACCTCSTPPAPSTRSTSPPAPPASTTSGVGRRVVARAGRAGHRRARRRAARAGRPARRRRPAVVLTARGAEQHARAPPPCSAWINVALALGMPGRPTPATAASPARATARAGASTARRPTSCPATG